MTQNKLGTAFMSGFFSLLVCGMAYGQNFDAETLADCKEVQSFQGIKSFEMDDGFGTWNFKTVPSDSVQVLYNGLDPEIAKKFVITNTDGELKISIKESYSMINGKIYFGQGPLNICSRGGGTIVSMSGTVTGSVCVINGEVFVNGRKVDPSSSASEEGYDISRFKVFVSLPENLSSYTFNVGAASANVVGSLKGNTKISLAGHGNFTAESIESSNVKAKIRGSGSVLVKGGQVKNLAAKISGSGRATFGTVVTENLDANVSGSGHIHVDATVNGGSAKVSGSGSITVRKAVGKLKQKTTGSGRIRIVEK